MKHVVYIIFVLTTSAFAFGQAQFKVLYTFGSVPHDGTYPGGSLVADRAGNLYGVASGGGDDSDGGTIFELSPNPDGSWNEATLYSFCDEYNSCPTGAGPTGTLAMDATGNLYGMTAYGGNDCPYTLGVISGCGVVYELSPPAAPGVTWTYSVLYAFCSVGEYCDDGGVPLSPVTFDDLGNLYGTTELGGGTNQEGVVFELSPSSSGWTETVLYDFCQVYESGFCLDGGGPDTGVTFDKSGNLFGTTYSGGSASFNAGGALYELSPGTDEWTETILAPFRKAKGSYSAYPGPVTIDPDGNLYTTLGDGGTYGTGGKYGYGSVFRLTTTGHSNRFLFNGTDGNGAYSGVIIDTRRGLLYGTTGSGLNYYNGNAYRIDRSGQETVLYTFCQRSGCADGEDPGGLFEDKSGNLYGVTFQGGAYQVGVAFEIIP